MTKCDAWLLYWAGFGLTLMGASAGDAFSLGWPWRAAIGMGACGMGGYMLGFACARLKDHARASGPKAGG